MFFKWFKPFLNFKDEVLKILDRFESERNLLILCVKGCSYALHPGHLLLSGLEFVSDFDLLSNAAWQVQRCDFKSAIFVDRETALDFLFSSFHRRQFQVKMTDLLVVYHKLVRTLIDFDA